MGSAIFYLKARYPSPAEARAAADHALPYFVDIEKLERDWGRLRNWIEKPALERYNLLIEKHPLAAEFLPKSESIETMDGGMNFMSHLIPDVEPGTVDFDLVVKGDVLYMKSWSWQHSDWDPLVSWLKKHGAKKVKWASSQDLGMEPGPKDWKPGGEVTPFDKLSI